MITRATSLTLAFLLAILAETAFGQTQQGLEQDN